MHLPDFPIDGSWVDLGCMISGVGYVIFCRFSHQRGSKLVCKRTGLEFANGASIFPLLVLALSSISSAMLKGLLESSRFTLTVAGLFALLAILEEDRA
jgi:hypothetical protein